jgi:hypothetical protein
MKIMFLCFKILFCRLYLGLFLLWLYINLTWGLSTSNFQDFKRTRLLCTIECGLRVRNSIQVLRKILELELSKQREWSLIVQSTR